MILLPNCVFGEGEKPRNKFKNLKKNGFGWTAKDDLVTVTTEVIWLLRTYLSAVAAVLLAVASV